MESRDFGDLKRAPNAWFETNDSNSICLRTAREGRNLKGA